MLLVVLYFTLKDNFSEIVKQLSNISKGWLTIAIIFMLVYGLLRSLSLHIVIKKFKKDFKFIETVKNLAITQLFNGITPFSTGGQPVQILFLRNAGINIPTATSIVLQNFMIYQIVLVFYGIISITLNNIFNFFPDVPILKRLVILGFLVNLFVVVFLILVNYSKNICKLIVNKLICVLYNLKLIKYKQRYINKYNYVIDKFYNSSRKIKKDKKTFILCIIFNFLAFILLYSMPLIIVYSTGDYHSFNFINSIVTTSYVMIIGAFVPIPGGTGGIEYSFVRFFGNYIKGYTLSTVLLIWRFITYYLGIIAGFFVMSLQKRRETK